jgi:hypothetical protein
METLPIRYRSLPAGCDLLYNLASPSITGVVPLESFFEGVEFVFYALSESRTFEHDG